MRGGATFAPAQDPISGTAGMERKAKARRGKARMRRPPCKIDRGGQRRLSQIAFSFVHKSIFLKRKAWTMSPPWTNVSFDDWLATATAEDKDRFHAFMNLSRISRDNRINAIQQNNSAIQQNNRGIQESNRGIQENNKGLAKVNEFLSGQQRRQEEDDAEFMAFLFQRHSLPSSSGRSSSNNASDAPPPQGPWTAGASNPYLNVPPEMAFQFHTAKRISRDKINDAIAENCAFIRENCAFIRENNEGLLKANDFLSDQQRRQDADDDAFAASLRGRNLSATPMSDGCP